MGSINEKLNYLNETKEAIKNELIDLGVDDITNETTFREYANKINGLYNDMKKVTDEGIAPHLTPTKTGKMALTLKGNTSQDTNILIYKCIGTEVGDYYFTYSSTNYQFTMPAIEAGNILTFNTVISKLYLGTTEISTTTASSGTLITLQATPNPDYSQAINVVTGEHTISLAKKNIYNSNNKIHKIGTGCSMSNEQANSFNLTGKTAWGNYGFQFKNYKKNTNYNINANFFETILNHSVRITVYGSNIAPYTSTSLSSSIGDSTITAITTNTTTNLSCSFNSGNYEYIVIRFWNNATNTALSETSNLLISNIQWEYGLTATTYEPYQEQTYPINLNNIELCKIDDYQDYIQYNETDNKWYKHKEIDKIEIDTQTIGIISSYTNIDYIKILKQEDSYGKGKYENTINMIASFAQVITVAKGGNWNSTNNIGYITGNARNSQWWIGVEKGTTLEQAQTKLTNSYLYYRLNESIEEEITDTTLITQLNTLKQAKSYNNQTNIIQTNDNLPFIINAIALLKSA